MELRKITIVSTKDQKKTVIESTATTLGELKADLQHHSIDYYGMTFYEGTSKVELVDDASVLPHDVPWKGTTTNELVFLLTNPNKKIKSGANITTRAEASAYFKANPAEAAKFRTEHEGKSWTNCSTAIILNFINTPNDNEENPSCEELTEVVDVKCRAVLKKLVEYLEGEGYLEDFQVTDILSEFSEDLHKNKSPYSDADIEGMFDFIK